MGKFIELQVLVKKKEIPVESLPFRVVDEQLAKPEEKEDIIEMLVDVDLIQVITSAENRKDKALVDCGDFSLLLNESYKSFKERFFDAVGQGCLYTREEKI